MDIYEVEVGGEWYEVDVPANVDVNAYMEEAHRQITAEAGQPEVEPATEEPEFEEPSIGGFIKDVAFGEQEDEWTTRGSELASAAASSVSKTGANILELGKDVYDYLGDWANKEFGDDRPEVPQEVTDAILSGTPEGDSIYSAYRAEKNEEAEVAESVDKDRAISRIIESAKNADSNWGYEGTLLTGTDAIKEADGILDKAMKTIEVGLGVSAQSSGEIVGMIANAPTQMLAFANASAKERMANDERTTVTPEDLIAGLVGAAVQTYGDKFQLGTATKAIGAKGFLKKLGVASATEVPQEEIDLLSRQLGTRKGVTEEEMLETAAVAAIAGGTMGGAVAAPAAVVNTAKDSLQKSADRKVKKQEEIVRKEAAVTKNIALLDEADAMNAQVLSDTKEMETEANDIALARRQEEQLAKTQAASAELQPDVLEGEFEEVTEEVEPVADITTESQTEETKVKRNKEDITATVNDNKLKRKEARAERVLDNSKSTVEQTERAEEVLEEVADAKAIIKAKADEQAVKRKKEDLATAKESFLSKVPTANGVKKKNAADTRAIAESLDIPVINDKGKKIPASTLKKAINEHPEVVKARDVTPAVSGKEVQDDKYTSSGVEYTPEEVAEQATVEAAFKPLPKEEAVETPKQAPAPVKQVTPTADTTVEKKPRRTLSLHEDGTTVIDQDGMPVDQSAKERARYFKKLDKKDPELLEKGDRGLTDLQKAEKALRALEYQDQAQTEQGGLTPKQVAAKDRLVAEIKKLKKEEVEEVAKEAAKETTRVKQDTTPEAAPEGVDVEGQAEVDAVEEAFDEEAAPDIDVAEAPSTKSTPEEALANSIKDMVKQELAKAVRAEGGVLPTLQEATAEPTVTEERRNVSLKELSAMTEAEIDSVIDGDHATLAVTDEVAQAYEDTQAVAELADTAPVQDMVAKVNALPTRLKNKIKNGYVKIFGMGPETVWAIENPDSLADVDERTAQLKEDGMKGADAFLQAVEEIMATVRESLPAWATPTPAETTIAEAKSQVKKEFIETEAEAQAELEKAFGSQFKNIYFKDGAHPSGRNVVGAYDNKTGLIRIWYQNVEKGGLAELMLHEKGVHELLAQDPTLQMEYQAVKDRMEELLKEGNEEVFEARNIAIAGFISKNERKPVTKTDNEIIREETIAYLMNAGVNKGWFARFARQVRKTFKSFFNIDLQPDDLRILVAELVQNQANKVQEELDTEQDTANTEADEAARIEAELMASIEGSMESAVVDDVMASENKEYQGTVAKAPRSFFQRVWDVSQTEGNWEAVKWGTRHIKDAPLKAWVPQTHLLRQAKELGLTAISKLEAVSDTARQEAQENIDYAITNVVKPARDLAQSNRKEYLKVVQMLWNATYNNKDLKKSAEFKRLLPEAQEVYKQVEAHYKKQGNVMLESMEAALTSDSLSEEHAKELQGYIDTFRHTLNNTVYFPMQRFGSRRITADNTELGRHVEFMDHTSEILEAKKELIKQGYNEADIKVSMVESLERDAKDSMDRETFDRAQNIIRNMEGSAEAQEALWKTFMAMAPSAKLKDRMSNRRFVKGASNRMVEGLNRSTSMFFEAAQRKHSPERSAMLLEAEQQLKDLPQVTPEEMRMHKKAEEVLQEVKLREKMIGKTRAKWSSNLSKANFFIHLGFNMSSAIINLTQNVIVGVPVLGARHGAGKAAMEMAAQFSNATKILGGNNPFPTDSAQYRAFKAFEEKGVINLTQAQMLQDISESDRNMIKDGVVENIVGASGWMFHKAEVANRITSSLASFNLNYDGSNFDEAVEQAVNDTREIHFDYSEEGKSRIQRGDIGGVALAFKSYPIQMAWYMANNFKKSMWYTDGTVEEKKAARTKIIGTLLMTQLFAGAMGLPLSSVFHFLADMLMDDEDDAHEMFKEFLRDNLGNELGDAVRMGIAGQLTGANLSSRTSLDQMFFRIPQGEARAADWSKSLMEAAIGPIGARLTTIPKGVDLMLEGKALAGMEAFMPAVYTNMSRATRWGAEGQANNAYDDLIEKDFSTYDAILKGVGFSSSEYQDTSEDLWMGKRRDNTISRKKRIALRDMAIAVIQGDSGDRREARRAIREWNRSNPDEKISQSIIKRRVRELRKKLRGEE